MNGWMDRLVDGWTDRRTDGWRDEWMNRVFCLSHEYFPTGILNSVMSSARGYVAKKKITLGVLSVQGILFSLTWGMSLLH